MKREKSIYDGNKRILDDEATYGDYNTILLINLVAEILVKITLTLSQSTPDPNTPQENNHNPI